MRPYVVRQGDYLVKLAWAHGFDVGEVWDHPKNEAIKKLRGDHHVLAPGDIIHIPVRARPALPLRKGQTNRYVAKVPKVPLDVVFHTSDGSKLVNEPCEIQGLGDSPSLPKATDGEGKLAFALPAHVREITIHFPRLNLSFQLRPGEMDPHDEATGIRKRLHHLGFGGERLITDVEDEDVLREAVERFQQAAGFEPTGELDERTREELMKRHGV